MSQDLRVSPILVVPASCTVLVVRHVELEMFGVEEERKRKETEEGGGRRWRLARMSVGKRELPDKTPQLRACFLFGCSHWFRCEASQLRGWSREHKCVFERFLRIFSMFSDEHSRLPCLARMTRIEKAEQATETDKCKFDFQDQALDVDFPLEGD